VQRALEYETISGYIMVEIFVISLRCINVQRHLLQSLRSLGAFRKINVMLFFFKLSSTTDENNKYPFYYKYEVVCIMLQFVTIKHFHVIDSQCRLAAGKETSF
jgi:hypothetical protein